MKNASSSVPVQDIQQQNDCNIGDQSLELFTSLNVNIIPNINCLKLAYWDFAKQKGEPLRERVCPQNNEKYQDRFKTEERKVNNGSQASNNMMCQLTNEFDQVINEIDNASDMIPLSR